MKLSFAGIMVFVLVAGTGVLVHRVLLNDGKLPGVMQDISEDLITGAPPVEVIADATKEMTKLTQEKQSNANSDRAARLLAKIDNAQANLVGDESPDGQQAWQQILIARYAGVAIDRSRFMKQFDDFATYLTLEHPKSITAFQGEMLQVLAKHDLRKPADESFVTDIQAFAANHSPNQCATLYCLAAQELVRNKQADAAKALIQRGLKAYKATPLAVSMLINQSADLGLSKPTTTGNSLMRYDALARSYETLSKGGGRSTQQAGTICLPRRGG